MRVAAIAIAGAFSWIAASAAERGTPAEAREMLAKAVAHYKAVGRIAAFADFNARKAPFFDRDLYVFCIGSDHMTLANGGYPAYVGTSVDAVKDADGRPMGTVILNAVAGRSEGSVEYRWLNPVSHKVEAKASFVQKLGDDVCGVGAYNPGG
jgi:cytochrome c